VRRRNRDAALLLLRRIVNLVVTLDLTRTPEPCFSAITFVNAAVNVVLP
jgi:hypothetical protein